MKSWIGRVARRADTGALIDCGKVGKHTTEFFCLCLLAGNNVSPVEDIDCLRPVSRRWSHHHQSKNLLFLLHFFSFLSSSSFSFSSSSSSSLPCFPPPPPTPTLFFSCCFEASQWNVKRWITIIKKEGRKKTHPDKLEWFLRARNAFKIAFKLKYCCKYSNYVSQPNQENAALASNYSLNQTRRIESVLIQQDPIISNHVRRWIRSQERPIRWQDSNIGIHLNCTWNYYPKTLDASSSDVDSTTGSVRIDSLDWRLRTGLNFSPGFLPSTF